MNMDGEPEPLIDYEEIRRRFPWVGCMESGQTDLSRSYRDLMAEGWRTHEIAETVRDLRSFS